MRKSVSILMLVLMVLVNSGLVLAIHHCHITETTTLNLALGLEADDPCLKSNPEYDLDSGHHIETEKAFEKPIEESNSCCSEEEVDDLPITTASSESCEFALNESGQNDNSCCETGSIEIDIDEFTQAQKLDNTVINFNESIIASSLIVNYTYELTLAYYNVNSPPDKNYTNTNISTKGYAQLFANSNKIKTPLKSDPDSDSDAPEAV